MAQSLQQSWEEEMMELARRRASEAALNVSREYLRVVLEERFGTIPEAVLQRIQQTDDPDRLTAGLRQALHITSPDELTL
jgi:hypothetical protein